jgi:UDP-glucose 4-epimerase
MNHKKNPVLVLGAGGFLGSSITRFLLQQGWKVRGFDHRWNSKEWQPYADNSGFQVQEDSIFDKEALRHALQDVKTVFNFLSFSVPNTSPGFLQNEVQTTLQSLEILLSTMVETGANRIIFPSSGGTVYGNTGRLPAKETDVLEPLSSYGMGKLLSEEIIRFYNRIHGFQYFILRISNVYGAHRIYRLSQGVIDVFLENILFQTPLKIWGNPDNVRDYLFIDDLLDVILELILQKDRTSMILNVGSGEGTSLREIMNTIRRVTRFDPPWSVDPDQFYGISYNVLDTSLIRNKIGWTPKYNIEQGIMEAWHRKQLAFSEVKKNNRQK